MFSSFMGSVLPAPKEEQTQDGLLKKEDDASEYETVEETSSSSSSASSASSCDDDDEDVVDVNNSNKQVVVAARHVFLAPVACKRSSVCSPFIDFSGEWTLVVSEDFKIQYDAYLSNLGLSWMVRSVATSVIFNSTTTEQVIQANKGMVFTIRSTTVRGVWDRTLQTTDGSSEQDEPQPQEETSDKNHEWHKHTICTAESEEVPTESWWENYGTIHRSYMYNTTKYNGGGDFESRRYLLPEGNTYSYVCESIFHPKNASLPKAQVTWRYCKTKEERDL